jgi:hypothetical protein
VIKIAHKVKGEEDSKRVEYDVKMGYSKKV